MGGTAGGRNATTTSFHSPRLDRYSSLKTPTDSMPRQQPIRATLPKMSIEENHEIKSHTIHTVEPHDAFGRKTRNKSLFANKASIDREKPARGTSVR